MSLCLASLYISRKLLQWRKLVQETSYSVTYLSSNSTVLILKWFDIAKEEKCHINGTIQVLDIKVEIFSAKKLIKTKTIYFF